MRTPVADICNLTLKRLGVSEYISSLEEKSKNASDFSLVFPNALRSVLAEYEWSFAHRVAELSPISNEKVPGWEHIYLYPQDCLKVRKVYQSGMKPEFIDPRHPLNENAVFLSSAGDKKLLACRVPQAICSYTGDASNPSVFSPVFTSALVIKMAYMMSDVVRSDAAKGINLLREYEMELDRAKRIDAQEQNKSNHNPSDYLEARG